MIPWGSKWSLSARSTQMAVLRALKDHFDPHGIMNPGGLLGLDLDDDQKRGS